jgi:hypothetical protein
MSEPTSPVTQNPNLGPASVLEPPSAAPGVPADATVRELFVQGKNGAAWFYGIAGLSVANTVLVLAGGGLRFAFGLVVTMFADAVAARALRPGGNMTTLAIALGFNAFVLALFVICGRLSQRRILPIYALGMALYLLDTVLSFLLSGFMKTGGGFIGLGIHAWVLWSMWSGFVAYRRLNVLERQMMTMHAATPGSL